MVSCDWTSARSSLKPSRVSTGSYCGSVPLWGGPNDQVGRLKDAAGPDGFKVCLFCHKQDVFQQLRWNNLNMYHKFGGAAGPLRRLHVQEIQKWNAARGFGPVLVLSICRATACLWLRCVRQQWTARVPSLHSICGSDLGRNNFAFWELIQFL